MYQEEDFQKFYNIMSKKFFEKHFAGKNIYNAIDETVTNALQETAVNSMRYRLIYSSLCEIKNNKEYWRTLDRKTKRQINQMAKSMEYIYTKLDAVLIPITDALET